MRWTSARLFNHVDVERTLHCLLTFIYHAASTAFDAHICRSGNTHSLDKLFRGSVTVLKLRSGYISASRPKHYTVKILFGTPAIVLMCL